MGSLRAADLVLAAAVASLCCAANGFTLPTAVVVGNNAACFRTAGGTSTAAAAIQPHQQQQQQQQQQQRRHSRGLPPLRAAGGEDDGIEEYKRQMAEFMAEAHEKRLQAMEAVKQEVQRGYEEQIADLQSKLAALPAPADADNGAAAAMHTANVRAGEPLLVGAGQGASVISAGSAAQHPSYAARSARPGWEARWGPEEPARASPAVTAADVSSMESRAAAASAPVGGAVHPAYAARAQRPGWEERWGGEEVARAEGDAVAAAAGNLGDVHPAYAARAQRPGWEERWGAEEPTRKTVTMAASTSASAEVATQAQGKAAAPADVHPAYAARTQRPGWEERWGAEEPARKTMATAAAAASTSASTEVATQALGTAAAPADVHPAYAARTQRPGWEERWGSEEPARISSATATPTSPGPAASAQAQSTAASPPADVHPAYAARAQRPGWEARWGSEEPARTTAAMTSTAGAPAASGKTAPPPAEDSHPAYAARSGRPGWEARWGSEEKERVAGAEAGAIAVAGAAAGFATAGGLDAASTAAAAAEGSSAASGGGAGDDPLADEFLPDDVAELRSMVVSNRRSFQDYLLKSLEASNQLKQSNVELEAELSRSKARLAAEEQLRESLQESYLDYMSRSGDAGAAGKAQVAKLEKDVLTLAAEADELKRFTQEYMVKASSDKQNALEEAAATARAQSAERIAALEAQVLELQAGG
ncbi:unnamed protein product [Ectocarpus fasciculatus]